MTRVVHRLLQLLNVLGLTLHQLFYLLVCFVDLLLQQELDLLLLVVLERTDLGVLFHYVLGVFYLLLYLLCLLSILKLGESGRFHFLEADRVRLRVFDHGLEVLRGRLLSVPVWRLTYGFLLDYLFNFLDGETDHTATNLHGLGAIWLELYVLRFGQDEGAEFRQVVLQLKLAFDRVKFDERMAP